MDRLKVGIIFGGCSEEHLVSVKSAQEVAKCLDLEKYEPFWIGITTTGAWKLSREAALPSVWPPRLTAETPG